MHREGGVDGGEARDEVALPCVDCFFGSVCPVEARRDALEVDVVESEVFFKGFGALVVQEVEDRLEAALGKVRVYFFVCADDGLGASIFYWFG